MATCSDVMESKCRLVEDDGGEWRFQDFTLETAEQYEEECGGSPVCGIRELPERPQSKCSVRLSSVGSQCPRPQWPGLASQGTCASIRLPSLCGVDQEGKRAASLGISLRSSHCRTFLTITITSSYEGASLAIDLTEGELTRGAAEGLPLALPADEPITLELRSPRAIIGCLRLDDGPPLPFGVQVSKSSQHTEPYNFVSAEHRQRTVVAQARELTMGAGFGASGEGSVIEAALTNGPLADMVVVVRRATKKELGRLGQKEALLQAMETKKYSSLLAQITRSKMRKVEAALIEQATRLLKSIRPVDGSFLTHKELGKLMRWKRVTSPADGTSDLAQPCSLSDSCPCNAGFAEEGEVCNVINGAVQQALDGVAPSDVPADKWLFQALVSAALRVPEGCVWKSGGKFLLTNEERNQSATAIVSVLERDSQESEGGKAIRALVEYTERLYNFRVTAIQLNFHPNQASSHKQHRDIYGAGQKGGINCTCSFMKCTGTVCYSVGSSRQVLCETITDKRSRYETCGEGCEGCKVHKWLHSGSSMYFNAPWNNNHTHGVPQMEESCGPRISIALLCA